MSVVVDEFILGFLRRCLKAGDLNKNFKLFDDDGGNEKSGFNGT